jgi:diamine N-acetyltransferase
MGEGHLRQTYLWLQNENLRKQIDCLAPPTKEGNRQYWIKCWADASRRDFVVLDMESRHVGNCGLCAIDFRRKKCEMWMYLGSDQGKGIGSIAVTKLIAIAFEDMGLERVYLRVLATNIRATRFYEKLGFVFEGRWREDTIVDDIRVDSLWYSMLKEEYIFNARLDKS